MEGITGSATSGAISLSAMSISCAAESELSVLTEAAASFYAGVRFQ